MYDAYLVLIGVLVIGWLAKAIVRMVQTIAEPQGVEPVHPAGLTPEVIAEVQRIGENHKRALDERLAENREVAAVLDEAFGYYRLVHPASVVAAWEACDELQQCMIVANWLAEAGDVRTAERIREFVRNTLENESLLNEGKPSS